MHKHPQSNNVTYSILITHNKGENILPIVTKPLFLYIYFIPNRLLTLFPHIYIYIYRILVHSTYEQYRALKNRDNSRISKGNRYPRMLYREHVVVGTVRVPLARSIAAEVSLVRRWRTSSRFIKPRPLSDFASCRPPRYYSPARSL